MGQAKPFLPTKQTIFTHQTNHFYPPNKPFLPTKQTIFTHQTNHFYPPNKPAMGWGEPVQNVTPKNHPEIIYRKILRKILK